MKGPSSSSTMSESRLAVCAAGTSVAMATRRFSSPSSMGKRSDPQERILAGVDAELQVFRGRSLSALDIAGEQGTTRLLQRLSVHESVGRLHLAGGARAVDRSYLRAPRRCFVRAETGVAPVMNCHGPFGSWGRTHVLAPNRCSPYRLTVQRSFDDLGTPLVDTTFCVLDLETTGASVESCGITEVGAVKVRGGDCLGTLQTLVNPGAAIPPEQATSALVGLCGALNHVASWHRRCSRRSPGGGHSDREATVRPRSN